MKEKERKMTEIEIGEDDWAFIARGGKGRIELFMPSKEEIDGSEIFYVLLGIKRFESALLEAMKDEAERNDGKEGD